MTEDQNKSVALIIPLIVTNNAGKVAIALRDAGYAKKFIPPGELEAGLFQLYTANPDKFFEVMKTIPWNYGEKTTNKPEIKDELIKLVVSNSRNADYEVDKETWWKELIAKAHFSLSAWAPAAAAAAAAATSICVCGSALTSAVTSANTLL